MFISTPFISRDGDRLSEALALAPSLQHRTGGLPGGEGGGRQIQPRLRAVASRLGGARPGKTWPRSSIG